MNEKDFTTKDLLTLIGFLGFLNIFVAPLVGVAFGEPYLEKASMQAAVYLFFGAVCIGCWFIGIKFMKLDAKGPVPWYASPVVWLSPLFVLTLTIMFRM